MPLPSGFGGGLLGGASVQIVISAVDKYSKELKKAKTSLESLKVVAAAAGAAMLGVGAGLSLLAASSIKAAINFEETQSKFNAVFKSIRGEADKTAVNLQENFGLSQRAAKQLLSDTGDLLTGFGFTTDEALKLSNQVQELAVDLASFTNIEGGAERASRALNSALVGEREALKSLQIVILEADIKARASAMGLTGELTRQQKSRITLQLATEQSKNALGDYGNTQDSAANQMKKFTADMEDLRIEMGQEMLPAFMEVFQLIKDNKEVFVELGATFAQFVSGVLSGVVKVANSLRKLGDNVVNDFATIKQALEELGKGNFGAAFEAVGEGEERRTLIKAGVGLESATGLAGRGLSTEQAQEISEMGISNFNDFTDKVKESYGSLEILKTQGIDETIKKMKEEMEVIDKTTKAVGEMGGAAEDVAGALDKVKEAAEPGRYLTRLGSMTAEEAQANPEFSNQFAVDGGSRGITQGVGFTQSPAIRGGTVINYLTQDNSADTLKEAG